LINRRHVRALEVKDRCVQLSMLRDRLDDTWHERWEYLQLILEVYQFARDAAIAETWLIAQESYLNNDELGDTVDQVENLIKRHEQFEKSLMAQEDRFNALRNLTTLEKKRQMPPIEPRQSRLPIYIEEFKTWEERDAERPASAMSPDKRSKYNSTIVEERSLIDGHGRSSSHAGKQRSSQESDTINGKQRRSESTTRMPTIKEGFLSRKHEWEGHERKASHRGWDKYYCALTSYRLSFYKDVKHMKTGRTIADDLSFDSVTIVQPATDYRKKSHVFRLKLQNGNEYLFHAKDETEMNEWMASIHTCISSMSANSSTTISPTQVPSIALTSPPTGMNSSSSSTNSPQHQLPAAMISSTSGKTNGKSNVDTCVVLQSFNERIRQDSVVVLYEKKNKQTTALSYIFSFFLGVELSQSSTNAEQKSRTLPLRSNSSVEGQTPSSSIQHTTNTSKKKSSGFFSMKRK
jgi:spectrin beta